MVQKQSGFMIKTENLQVHLNCKTGPLSFILEHMSFLSIQVLMGEENLKIECILRGLIKWSLLNMMLFRVFAFVIENQLYKETETLHRDRIAIFWIE